LLSASRDERIGVLKGIIGFEEYESLSKRVHAATSRHRVEAESAALRFAACDPVSDEELAAVQTLAAMAATDRDAARERLTTATQRVEQAKQWESLERRRRELESMIEAADERCRHGEQIREDQRRLDDLTTAVPVLSEAITLRGRIAELQVAMTTAQADVERLTTERDALASVVEQARQKAQQHGQQVLTLTTHEMELSRAIERGEQALTTAVALASLDEQLAQFPVDLDLRAAEVAQAVADAETTERSATEAKATAGVRLTHAEEHFERFAGVTAGATCSHCGQFVDEAHAARERERLDAELNVRRAELDRAHAAADVAREALTTARSEQGQMAAQLKNRDDLLVRRDTLCATGEVVEPAVLREQLDAQREEQVRIRQERDIERTLQREADTEVMRGEKAHKLAVTRADEAESRSRDSEQEFATARSREGMTVSRLTPVWQSQLADLDIAAVKALTVERDRLKASGVEAAAKALERDEAMRAEWDRQLTGVASELADLPETARITEAQAKLVHMEAERSAKAADQAWLDATRTADQLVQRRHDHERLMQESRAAEKQHRLHKKLNEWLGETKLQRALVREAEEQIVAFANETLQHLSDGDLTLEEEIAAGTDKTFDLQARRGGGEPIGVEFLSGSQRFRVAVSLALAVGRFASGRARPLESVIIDEGFGSLDRDGLRAMAEELMRLQREEAITRIILVSHQAEFTDHFPVGYQFSPGEFGTTAKLFRK
jgi:DNA repair exonuclease SbcCD ATPase subunit